MLQGRTALELGQRSFVDIAQTLGDAIMVVRKLVRTVEGRRCLVVRDGAEELPPLLVIQSQDGILESETRPVQALLL